MGKIYVVTYAFDRKGEFVLLIKKNKPDHLRGLWNGPGGKVENDELILDAAIREFREETGIGLPRKAMEHVFTMKFYLSDRWLAESEFDIINFYTCRTDLIFHHKQMEDEEVAVHHLHNILHPSFSTETLVNNLYWMLPYCVDTTRYQHGPLEIMQIGVER